MGRLVEYKGGIGGTLAANTTTIIGRVPTPYRPPDGTRTITAGAATQGAAALTNGGTCRVATGTSGAIIVHVSSGVTTGVNLSALSGYLAA